jgi:hypothetical protein
MADLNIQKTTLIGLNVTYSAADVAGDRMINDGNTVFKIKNADAAAKTVTINSAATCNYGFDHDLVISVPAGEEREIGPFPRNRFNDDTGKVNVTYDGVTSVTVAAVSR